MSLGMVAGSSIWICSNGMMSGEITYMRKHTGTVAAEMNAKMDDVIIQLQSTLDSHVIDMVEMQGVPINDVERDYLLGRMFFRDKIISPHQAPALMKEIEEPEFKEFKEDNLWGMYNKITHVLKKEHPDQYMQKHVKLHELVTNEYL
jgi:hypothetical protein